MPHLPDEPIPSEAALPGWFQAGEKPPAAWRIGTEHEKFGFTANLQPLSYSGGEVNIQAILRALTTFGWEPAYDHGLPIALTRGRESITLEPGGQLELSGAPQADIHGTAAELRRHFAELRQVSEPLGVTWAGLGLHPFATPSVLEMVPKTRYKIMSRYLPTRGADALKMMFTTCTVQANIDFASEADMARKMRAAQLLSPFVAALFCNSSLTPYDEPALMSRRYAVWCAVDPDRCGLLPALFANEPFTYEKWTQYVLDVPMFVVARGDTYHEATQITFRRFLREGFAGERATWFDWERHVASIFTEVRLKRYIELRGADMNREDMVLALPALWKGLLYDEAALEESLLWIAGPSLAEYQALQAVVAREGLQGTFRGRPLAAWGQELVNRAAAGLERQNRRDAAGRTEAVYLEPLREVCAAGVSPARVLLNRWGGHHRTPESMRELAAAARVA